MHILVTSPIPTHPLNHGNRVRVWSLCRALQLKGHTLHMVYTGFEGLSQDQEEKMRQTWDEVTVLDAPAKRPKPLFKHHHIDAWYPKDLDATIDTLMRTWRFDACIANYVWCSKWLARVPPGIPTFLDTHDRFADRHARLKSDGLEPSWFSTSTKGEAKALNRAQTIIAIQDEEAQHFSNLTNRQIEIVGHIIAPSYLPSNFDGNRPLRLGYLASNNPLNMLALEHLAAALKKHPLQSNLAEIHLAGPISDTPVAREVPNAHLHGFVESPENFYNDIDVILNPHVGGTGLKIKSVEALAFGKPLIATTWAMIGIYTNTHWHQFESVDQLVLMTKQLIEDKAGLSKAFESLSLQSRQTFERYHNSQTTVIDRLFPSDSNMIRFDSNKSSRSASGSSSVGIHDD